MENENGRTKKQQKLVEKIGKKLPEFQEEVERMQTAEMEDLIVRYTADLAEVEKSLENNTAYQALKEQMGYFEAPVRDAKGVLNDKIKFLILSIEEKGGSPNTNPRG